MEEQETLTMPAEPTSKGALWRLQAIFFEPSAAFEDINIKPGFMVPLIAGLLLALLTWQAIGHLVNLEDLLIASIKSNPRVADQLTPEQMQQQARFSVPIIQYAAPIAGVPIMIFLTSGVLMLMVWISGAETTFTKIAGVVSLTMFLQAFVGAVLLILVFALAADPLTINLENPLMTNPGSLVDARESPVLNRLLSSLDIVVWYVIFLLGLGLSKIARPMKTANGVLLVAIPYLLYVGIRMAIAALF